MSTMSTPPTAKKTSRRQTWTSKLRRKPKNPTGEMTLVQHLQELRRRIVISLLALVVGTIVGFIWYQNAPFNIAPLGEILRGPYCSLPEESRVSFSADGECRLLATSPFEMLLLRLKVGALAGAVLSSPVWLYQIWAFIVPGLHKNERRFTFFFVFSAVVLFVLGAVLAYFILSVGLEFLMGMGEEFQTAALTGERYFYFLLALLMIFGVSFEIPLLIVCLNMVGVLEYQHVKDKRRIIIVAIMIFAAVVTPGQEPFSMLVLALALVLLVEIAFQFCRINDKRRNRTRPEWMDLDDETASPLGEGPGGIEAPTPVEAPTSVTASPTPSKATPPSTHTRTQPPQGGFFDDVL
ncbi:twin-arginine translocase subunit TatC [Corynebacterium sp. FDAARGOS 1242]|uniref:twin-arginine translocase subunit TatC n=1 Tax=Corynebacterium sp. FDAARGOS 1242 TaxID=2778078 RepID=UPI00351C6D94